MTRVLPNLPFFSKRFNSPLWATLVSP
jgi:hypothetical protein